MRKFAFILLTTMLLGVCVAFAGDENKKSSDEGKVKEEQKKESYTKRKASNPEITIETDYGTMKLELFRDVAPIHVDSMLSRIREGFYNGLIFHRIIDGFMIQGGDPTGTGRGNAGYYLPAEFSKLKHIEGTLSMARAQAPNSASCQFFICLAPQPFLDGKYTIFGQLMEGYDVLHKIGSVQTGKADRPSKDVYMRRVTILKDVDGKETK